jgi:hypothetical protein
MKRHWQYLKYVLRHKWYVLLAGIGLRVPLHILLLHDWDKFLPDEWFPYARTFYAPDGTKQYIESVEFARAWMLHQHRNKHHWQYWLWVHMASHNCAERLPQSDYLVWDRGEAQRVVHRNSGGTQWYELQESYPGDVVCCPDVIPDVYMREMLADWRGAGRALGKPNTWEWYEANKDKMLLNAVTRAWIEAELEKENQGYNRRVALGI